MGEGATIPPPIRGDVRMSEERTFMSPEQFGVYVQKVNNLEDKFNGLDHKIDALSTKLDRRSQPQYQLLISIAAIVTVIFGGMGTYFYLPVRQGLDKLADDVQTTYVPAKYIDKINALEQARRDDWQKLIENRLQQLALNQENVRESIIKRSEHEQHWKMEAENVLSLQKQIDTMTKTLGEVFPVHDTIASMQKRLDEIQGKGK